MVDKRIDPTPDPFAKLPTDLARNPGRSTPKQVAVDSTRPVARMRAHVHSSSATQSIPSGVPTVVSFNVTDYDTAGLFTASRFTIPHTGKVTGPWRLRGRGIFVAAAGGTVRELILRKNGATNVDYAVIGPNVLSALSVDLTINDPNPGDFFELVANQDSGGALNLTTAPEKCFFELVHLW